MAVLAKFPERVRAMPRVSLRLLNTPLTRFLSRRLVLYAFTVWASVTLAFLAFRLMPGDPMSIFLGQLSGMRGTPTEMQSAQELVEFYRTQFGLDQPLLVQYALYLRNIVLGGLDLGPSFMAYPTPARDLIFQKMGWTLGLFTTSMLIAWLIGTSLGTLMGWLRRRRLSTIATVISTLLMSTPVYLIALAAIIVIGYELRWLPTGRPYDTHLQPELSLEFIGSVIHHAILPLLSMVVVWGAGFALGMRSLMISVLGEDYLTYAKAKGLSPRVILKDYAFRNALLPQVTALAIILGTTLNGAFIIEILFVYPGLGSLFVRAMGIRDFNVMQGIVLFSSFTVLTLSLLVDLVLPLLDPRIRRTND